MTKMISKTLLVNNRLEPVTGVFGLPVKNSFLNHKMRRYLLFSNAFIADSFLKNRLSFNSPSIASNQIPIDLLPKQVSQLSPAVSSLEAYQTPAR
ncbi:MAG: hypothetical protein HOM14_19810 [Gammaproteobacteria bacterium]|jgi:hypothetical protein|nr:hypothetical protein [Gammaproteobacteria bacterium]MBT3725261.1 hypothetical protein [Gammaproteobacteria bacterium]MBT4077376.1 hypothetical protein [Gammaproteobacteria bacterium]MBT4195245.1 hypothetical protein [Gammaproteobacteria bacterium]MBT4451994.1 hypothetical protein [Gammaproteobacteria bacterium]